MRSQSFARQSSIDISNNENTPDDHTSRHADRQCMNQSMSAVPIEETLAGDSGPVSVVDSMKRKCFIKSRKQFVILLTMSVYYFTVTTAYSMIAPFFPQMGKAKGADKTITGLIFAVYPLAGILLSPVIGAMLPVLGPRFTLTVGLFVEGVTQILFGFLDLMPDGTIFITFCFLIRIVMAVGGAAASTADMAILTFFFKDNLAPAMGFLEIFSGAGLTAGPAIGGVLYGIGGFKTPFFVVGSCILASVLLIFCVLPSDVEMGTTEKGSVLEAIKIPQIMIMYAVISVGGLALSFLDPTLAFHLDKFKLSEGQLGLMFLISPCLYAFFSFPIGLIISKKNGRPMMLVGCALLAIAYLLLGPSPILPSSFPRTLWMDGISLAILGLGCAPLFLPCLPDMNDNAVQGGMPDGLATHSVISGLFNSGFNVGGILGPTAAGAFSQYFGFPWASTMLSGVVVLLAVIIIFGTVCRRPVQSIQQVSINNDETTPLLA